MDKVYIRIGKKVSQYAFFLQHYNPVINQTTLHNKTKQAKTFQIFNPIINFKSCHKNKFYKD